MAEYDTIFISHAHHDQGYVKQLVDLIKVLGFNNIVCSSYPGHNIPQDENIYNYLKERLSERVWVLFVLSKQYYQSAACLNEMGATWVLGKHYTTILLPNYSFSAIRGAVDPSRVSFKLNEKEGLNDFKENLINFLQLESPNANLWESARDDVIQKVNNFAVEERKKDLSERVEVDDIVPRSESNITLMLRLINDNDYSVDFHRVKVTLTDSEKNSSSFEISIQEKLHHKENKIFPKEITLVDDMRYNPFLHTTYTVDWVARRNY
ncbi:toll/interleukin-1 receptor domain-containing protein [Paenibacillus amylolyticus]|uniref:toll/interleukin-1 receptor domain-containing protein n=1 Tax=Paenibacillus amylolyticus TaxID=1451 RepID=UPI003396A323